MLSKFIGNGDKVDLQAVDRGADSHDNANRKVYGSTIHRIVSEDTIELLMPMERDKVVLLPDEKEYDLVIYTPTGLYQCFARIAERFRSNNAYVLVLELTSNLRKYQRREYYRFSCVLDMQVRNLEDGEVELLEQKNIIDLVPGLPMKHSVIVDISGGGLRFLSDCKYKADSLIYINYCLVLSGVGKRFEMIGKVLSSRELENRRGTWEHRVQYTNISAEVREEIIRYIFEEERKSRRTERF